MNSKVRKIGKVLAGFLFTLFLTIFTLFFSFAQITDYSKLKPYAVELITSQITQSQKDQLNLFIEGNCRNSKTAEINILDEKIVVDCQSKDFVSDIAEKSFDNIYFRNYSCSLLDCVRNQQTMFAAFSSKANNFANSYLILFAILTVISTVFLVYFLRGWGIPKGIGLSMVSVGISYFILGFVKNVLPKDVLSVAGPFINFIIDTIAYNFLLVLISGIVLTAIGIVGSRLSKENL